MRGLQCSRRPMKFSVYSIDAGIVLSRVPVRMESECAPVTSGVLGLVLRGCTWLGHRGLRYKLLCMRSLCLTVRCGECFVFFPFQNSR